MTNRNFVIKNKSGTDVSKAPSLAELVDGYDVNWHYWPTEYIGDIPETQFYSLKHKLEDTGFYVMFDARSVHTH